jgi:hypothetical protein
MNVQWFFTKVNFSEIASPVQRRPLRTAGEALWREAAFRSRSNNRVNKKIEVAETSAFFMNVRPRQSGRKNETAGDFFRLVLIVIGKA